MFNSNVFSRIELATSIICNTLGCDDSPINIVFFPMDEEMSFLDSFNEEENKNFDVCKKCAERGILGDIFPYFFYSLCDPENHVVAFKMNLSTIESLTRAIKNSEEDGGFAKEKVYLTADAMFDCYNNFHVFQIGANGDFDKGDWNFEVHPFNERNKVVTVSELGVRLSCDISTKGDNQQDNGTVSTCWLNLVDLAELNGWITKRVSE